MITNVKNIVAMILIVSTLVFYYIYRKNNKKHVLMPIAVAVVIAVLISAASFHFENLLIRYRTPESAFSNSGYEGKMKKILETDRSVLIVFQDDKKSYGYIRPSNNNNTCMLLLKDGDRYRVPLTRAGYHTISIDPNITIQVYQEKDTDCYYMMISAETDSKISDEQGTIFNPYEKTENRTDYVAVVSHVDSSYRLTIADHEIALLQEISH